MPLPKLTRLGNLSPSNHPERHLEIKVRRALQIPALIPDITEVLGETGMSSWCCQQSKEQMQDLRGCHHNPWDPSPGGLPPKPGPLYWEDWCESSGSETSDAVSLYEMQ